MKALMKTKPEVGIWMADVPVPEVGPNDVKVKIKKTAICGTDIHIYNWDGFARNVVPVPLVTGHEFVGEIVEMGSKVNGFEIGARVSGEGHIACRVCRNCRGGYEHLCKDTVSVGVTRQGAFSEYLVIPAVNAYPIPDDVSDNEASVLDPLGNAVHTALSYDLAGEDVLITGAGPVGLMSAVVAKHVGARHVVITDVNDYRLGLAKNLGIENAINVENESIPDVMKKLKMTEGFDVGLEMSGNPHAFNSMLESMCYGGKLALLGFLPESTRIDWHKLIFKGLFIKGIYGREMYETWYEMIAMLQSGLDIKPAITHEYHIDDFQEAFEMMRGGKTGKVILNWD